jgi:hypothetical protein
LTKANLLIKCNLYSSALLQINIGHEVIVQNVLIVMNFCGIWFLWPCTNLWLLCFQPVSSSLSLGSELHFQLDTMVPITRGHPSRCPYRAGVPSSEGQFKVKRQNGSWKMPFLRLRWMNLVSLHLRDNCITKLLKLIVIKTYDIPEYMNLDILSSFFIHFVPETATKCQINSKMLPF